MDHLFLSVLFVVIVAVYYSLCLDDSKHARILLFKNENIGLTSYNFKFETSNGIQREEHGEITDPKSENAILRVQGSYSYITPDGRTFTVHYVADDQGYRPETSVSVGFVSKTRVGTPVITSLQGGNTIG